MKYLSLTFLVMVFSESVMAQNHSTEDWSGREAFVNPSELNEKEMQSWEGGSWQEEGLAGTYRFIITQVQPGKDKLYVQWLLGNKEIAYSMSIKELNVRPEYDIELPVCTSDSCEKLFIEAKHLYEESRSEFILTLQGLGRYAFSL